MLAVLLFAASLTAQELPPEAQALLNQARAADPQRFQFAVDQGVKFLPTSDKRTFYLLWYPPGSPKREHPLIVTMHGTTGWATNEFYLWHAEASRAGYGILALQWWFGSATGQQDYYGPEDLHRELRGALKAQGNREGSALLHGFSRGSANIYAVATLDRQSRDRNYAMFLANSGGAMADFPPNAAIARGEYGYNIFSGTYWTMFCGALDPNPDRDGCPAMRRTSDWVAKFGGVLDLFIEDPASGHGGFHQSAQHVRAAVDAFTANLALRRRGSLTSVTWQVKRDDQFEIPNASTPNAGLVNGDVWLIVNNNGLRLYRSPDGSNASSSEALQLATAMSDSGYAPGEVIPREDAAGNPVLYVLGLAPPGANRAAVFRLVRSGSGYSLNPSGPVFQGGPDDGQFIGVPDVTPASDDSLRLTYVARGAARSNSRTAVSTDGGASFHAEFRNPLGDFAVPNPRASDTNVDPAVLRLASGGFLGVGMRGARLYLFTSIDGRTFTPCQQGAIDADTLAPGATGLFDPTLVQLPDGRVFLYATAGADPGSGSRIVRAELVRIAPNVVPHAALQLPAGTIRPEVLVTSAGEFVVVVAEPEGIAAGQVKHRAYRYNTDWEPIGSSFAVTRITTEYGEPADHRATLVNDELVVVYQSLVYRERPSGGGPAENFARDQSLLLARLTLDGREILRKPIVANAPDRNVENFPDHCVLWRGDHLLVSTGTLSGTLKIRKVDLNANVLETVVLRTSEDGIPDNIGNSFLADEEKLWMLSATGPHRSAAMTVTELDDALQPGRRAVFEIAGREQHFPVSATAMDEWIFVAYESRPRSGGGLPEQSPYSPYLKILTRDFVVARDVRMGDAGAVAVHPVVVRTGNRLIFAWSESVAIGSRTTPRVRVEEYRLEP